MGEKLKALSDAEEARSIEPGWTKIYHRKALALISLERYEEACIAYDQALGLDSSDTFMMKMRKKIVRTYTVNSRPFFLRVYASVKNIRVRLATIATFWNLSSKADRLVILNHLIALLRGDDFQSDEVQKIMARYDEEKMQGLPMKNYADVTIQAGWCKWYTTTSQDEKVKLLCELWKNFSKTEHELIVKDMRAFFMYASS